MGFSPLQGLIIGNRAGDVDPGIITYLMRNDRLDADEMDSILNSKNGLLGISGVSPDMRDTLDAAEKGTPRALIAVKAFCYRLKHYIGAYAAILGGAGVLVFTGGIGENAVNERGHSLQGLEKIGFAIDPLRNERCSVTAESPVCEISASYSKANIMAESAVHPYLTPFKRAILVGSLVQVHSGLKLGFKTEVFRKMGLGPALNIFRFDRKLGNQVRVPVDAV